ncbi:MAG: aminoacetone oxidase family FAD-binding enzyme [Planctomycetota bacterium]|nr:aminoacetone oxidase family FAD-binding enzyme [Planctomycetota bacterium]
MPNQAGRDSLFCDVAVIGAGGAGLLAGIAAARAGAKTVLFERMRVPAKKVAISGGGRCNFSNTLDPRRFVKLFGDEHARFLGHALKALSNAELQEILARHGVDGQVERNYRLYTKSGRGADVVKALVDEFQAAGGQLITGARIVSLERGEAGWTLRIDRASPEPARGAAAEAAAQAVPAHLETHLAKGVVVCTGGLSYAATGSTGDGYAWAKALGHTVTKLRPALVGLTLEEAWPRAISGLAWDDAAVELRPEHEPNAKPLSSERAEILFTHFGISGPAIIDTSNAFVRSGLPRAHLKVDFFPAQPREALDADLLARFKAAPQRSVARALDGLLPSRLLERFEMILGDAAAVPVARLPKDVRQRLLEMLKATRLTVTGTRGIEYGEVTDGGIAWEEIEPTTLESRKAPGLYFAGEILDLTGRCGGFNLQAAFSTGYLAGKTAAKRAPIHRRNP